ncbi:MAG: FAD-binding domain-containing protein [Pseudomonadota bacterium]
MSQASFFEGEPLSIAGWSPNRAAALDRLARFRAKAGSAYARSRNSDFGPDRRTNVSALSPWVRHRLILEEEILQDVLVRHSISASEKFVQEVFWRGYFKGWLEHRPEVWRRYRQSLNEYVNTLDKDADLARRYEAAIAGKTGIECFDTWSAELIETGYLHNHARMWFASIWIFTLRLPWELGADFFYRHLLDGDPASNTCSWRWVGGLHTAGKTYLARASNIETYTDGRFNPAGQLATDAPALTEPALPDPIAPRFDHLDLPGVKYGLLITEEDCSPESLNLPHQPEQIAALTDPTPRSVLPVSELVQNFAPLAVADAANRAAQHFQQNVSVMDGEDWADSLKEWMSSADLDAIVTPKLPIGPVKRRLRRAATSLSLPLIETTRLYDQVTWPHARRGFFGLKKKIPRILSELAI